MRIAILSIRFVFLTFTYLGILHGIAVTPNSIRGENTKKPIQENPTPDEIWKTVNIPLDEIQNEKEIDYRQISIENRKDQRRVYRVSFTSDNQYLLVVTSFRLSLYRIPELVEVGFLEPRTLIPGGFTGVSLSQNGKEILAGASWENAAYLFDWSGNKLKKYSCKDVYSYPEDVKFSSDNKTVFVSCLQFAKDKRYLATYKVTGEEISFTEIKHSYMEIINNRPYPFSSKEIYYTDLSTGKSFLIPFTNHIQSFTFFNDKEWIAGSEGQWTLYSLTGSWVKKSTFKAEESGFMGEDYSLDVDYRSYVAFSPSGKYFLTGGRKGAYIWAKNGKLVKKLPGHLRNVSAVGYSPDGEYIITASPEKIILWSRTQEPNLE